MNKIGIIGFGEIGSSLKKIYDEKTGYEVKVVDPSLGLNDDISDVDILNICIPYSKNFIKIVKKYIKSSKPKYTVIHSTVAPGTTEKIGNLVCHSPVRGLHPNLDLGLKTFLKYIGCNDNEISKKYQEHLNELDISSYICKNSKTTEYAKLLDTTYYGICIAYHSDVLRICEKENLNFDEMMTIYNKSYNEGYKKLQKENVVRPILHGTDKIGGHCIVPNAKILKQFMNSDLIKSILKYE
jgi:UDP-N-acetyl-D-mannosaminuronate dehydrogenase